MVPAANTFELGDADKNSNGEEVIFVPDTATASPVDSATVVTWVLNGTPDSFGEINAAWWIEWTDSIEDGFFNQIKCRMWSQGFAEPRSGNPFPLGANIIPLGYARVTVSTTHVYDLGVTQYVSSNLTDRYQPPMYPLQVGVMNYRGDWNDDALSGQFFFPGDVVEYLKEDGVTQLLWVYTQAPAALTDLPVAGPWRLLAQSTIT